MYCTIPTLIPGLSSPLCFPIYIACGSSHSLCLSEEGEVYSWGEGGKGQLGIGEDLQHDRPPYYVHFLSIMLYYRFLNYVIIGLLQLLVVEIIVLVFHLLEWFILGEKVYMVN